MDASSREINASRGTRVELLTAELSGASEIAAHEHRPIGRIHVSVVDGETGQQPNAADATPQSELPRPDEVTRVVEFGDEAVGAIHGRVLLATDIDRFVSVFAADVSIAESIQGEADGRVSIWPAANPLRPDQVPCRRIAAMATSGKPGLSAPNGASLTSPGPGSKSTVTSKSAVK